MNCSNKMWNLRSHLNGSMKTCVILLYLFQTFHLAAPSQQTFGSGTTDPFADFNNDFMGPEFDEMDRDERIYNEFDAGLIKWEDRCLNVGGQEALDQWLKYQEALVWCVMQNFESGEIEREIRAKEKTGDLDLVFKKYCGEPVRKTRPCIEDFLNASRRCLKAEDQEGLNIALRMIDSAIEFMCHNSGDRIALFMSHDGAQCLKDHREDIMKCINASLPNIFSPQEKKHHSSVINHLIFFSRENCRKGEAIRNCVEKSLLSCNDPTPSNVVNSLLLSMRNATPCKSLTASYTAAATAPSLKTSTQGQILLMTLMLVIVAYR